MYWNRSLCASVMDSSRGVVIVLWHSCMLETGNETSARGQEDEFL
jgi:hypothetical protein